MGIIPRPLALVIMGIVTLVWVVNFAAQFFVPGYSSDPLIHGIFMGIVGGTMALTRKSNAVPPAPTPPAAPEVDGGQGRHQRGDAE